MISICIPTHNYIVVDLVKSLVDQGLKLDIDFEVIVSDDGSSNDITIKNSVISSIENCYYYKHDSNLGLSENRNTLAEKASYKYLLFLDGDSKIISPNFIKSYLKHLSENSEVIYGGRVHPKSVDSSRTLRWKYGIMIEDKTKEQREKTPFKSTLFNNTLISKDLVLKIKFDKSISTYGHEDTLFAFQLAQHKSNVQHIDNPVEHGDIDTNTVYIQKTQKALKNLYVLYDKGAIDPEFVKFLRAYHKLQKLQITGLISFMFRIFKPRLDANLMSSNPSLTIFNMYRLGYFCQLSSKAS